MDRDLGAKGEYLARLFLENEKDMAFIRANYATRQGEVDLILYDQDTLVFAEVKTRTSTAARKYGRGSEKIDVSKQEKIIKAARQFIREEPALCRGRPFRFDAVEIYLDPADPKTVRVIHTPWAFSGFSDGV